MARDQLLIMLDSKVISSQISQLVESHLSVVSRAANDLAEAERILEQSADQLLAAVVNPTFGNVRNQQAIEAVLHHRVPCLVVTSSFSETVRDQLLEMGVLDYFLKDVRLTDNIIRTVKGLKRNLSTRVLVVDDSQTARDYYQQLLELQGCDVCVACHGQDAIETLAREENIRLVVTDYDMPHLNGVGLARTIRETADRDAIAIIGLSGSSDRSSLSAEFLKNGANDFLPKSCSPEEFHCRVALNLELLEHIDALRQARQEAETLARTDGLTGVNNRRAFMECGDREADRARRQGKPLSVLLLDIDYFKKINDDHGHATGDTALQYLARTATQTLRVYDLFGRLGGEEFAAILPETSSDEAMRIAERLRLALSRVVVPTQAGDTVQFTVSIGVADRIPRGESIAVVLSRADAALYEAKRAGRNRVVLAEDPGEEPVALSQSA